MTETHIQKKPALVCHSIIKKTQEIYNKKRVPFIIEWTGLL